MSKNVEACLATIRTRAGAEPVRLGLILGSGLGHLAGAVEGVAIPYADLPGFPHVGVSGHNPNLVIGDLEGVRVAVFGAREHYYENGNPAAMRLPLTVLQALGATALLTTIFPLNHLSAALISIALMAFYVLFGGVWGAGMGGVAKLILLYVSAIVGGILVYGLAHGFSGLLETLESLLVTVASGRMS